MPLERGVGGQKTVGREGNTNPSCSRVGSADAGLTRDPLLRERVPRRSRQSRGDMLS